MKRRGNPMRLLHFVRNDNLLEVTPFKSFTLCIMNSNRLEILAHHESRITSVSKSVSEGRKSDGEVNTAEGF